MLFWFTFQTSSTKLGVFLRQAQAARWRSTRPCVALPSFFAPRLRLPVAPPRSRFFPIESRFHPSPRTAATPNAWLAPARALLLRQAATLHQAPVALS